jgi:hypothetical protein
VTTGHPPRFCCYPNTTSTYVLLLRNCNGSLRTIPNRCSLTKVCLINCVQLLGRRCGIVKFCFLFYFRLRKCTQNRPLYESTLKLGVFFFFYCREKTCVYIQYYFFFCVLFKIKVGKNIVVKNLKDNQSCYEKKVV